MRFDSLIGVLLPHFDRNKLIEEIESAKTELVTATIPAYKSAVNAFGYKDFHSPEVREFDKEMRAHFGWRQRGNFLVVVNTLLVKLNGFYPTLTEAVENKFAEDVTLAGMTYTRATVIQLIGAARSYQAYARLLLRWTYYKESIALSGPELGGLVYSMAAPELAKLTADKEQFFNAYASLHLAIEGFDTLEKVPDVVIDKENSHVVANLRGINSLDPFHTRALDGQPLMFCIRKWWSADSDLLKREAAIEEAQMLELQLLNLEQLARGKDDPKLQRRIEVTQERLEKLLKKIEDLER